MCSITGAIIKYNFTSKYQMSLIEFKMKAIMLRAEDRGRDSFGVVTLGNSVHQHKYIGSVSDTINNFSIPSDTNFILSNNRAEPTTEYIHNKTLDDVQPFFFKNSILVHNGIIANDNELPTHPKSRIDSASLCHHLDDKFNSESPDKTLASTLKNDIVGSYALAYYNEKSPNCLYLATNYKPLFLQYDRNLDVIFFASMKEYFGESKLYDNTKILQIPSYTLAEINLNGHITYYDLKIPQSKKVLVICSGGLDSTIVANHYLVQGYDVDLLHFKYKCRAEEKEEKAILDIRQYFNKIYPEQKTEIITINTDIFETIGHSRLIGNDQEIVTTKNGVAGAELAHEWVPARNLIMYSIATGIAEANKYSIIALGNNLEESGAYPDNEAIFTQKFSEILPYATNLNNHVDVEMPVGNLMKHEIVKLGILESAPLHLTWSCYDNKEKHCGICGPCMMRRTAFEMNNMPEVIHYLNEV